MLEKITETTANEGLSSPGAKKLLRVAEGEFASRMMAVIRTAPNQLAFSWADAPDDV